MEIDESKFEKARWPNGPLICTFENLPAYPTVKDLNHDIGHFHLVVIRDIWKCPRCGMYHAKSVGTSRASGTGSNSDKITDYKTSAEKAGLKLADLK